MIRRAEKSHHILTQSHRQMHRTGIASDHHDGVLEEIDEFEQARLSDQIDNMIITLLDNLRRHGDIFQSAGQHAGQIVLFSNHHCQIGESLNPPAVGRFGRADIQYHVTAGQPLDLMPTGLDVPLYLAGRDTEVTGKIQVLIDHVGMWIARRYSFEGQQPRQFLASSLIESDFPFATGSGADQARFHCSLQIEHQVKLLGPDSTQQ